jgi:putative heme iron utilization protein
LYFYISDIAQHAKNLEKDSRMSLTVFHQAQEGDQNAHGRVTLVGDATPLKGDKAAEVLEQYVLRFPEAEGYKKAHDFKVWQMDITRVRFIGGFGKIFWLEQEEWNAPASDELNSCTSPRCRRRYTYYDWCSYRRFLHSLERQKLLRAF